MKWTTLIHSCLFILGFSTVFILMGASVSYLGQVLSKYQTWIMKIGGILIILLGIHFILQIFPFLQIEKRFEMKKKPLGYLGSFLVGIVFAAGWTPCIGPILSTILIYASTSQQMTTGIILLAAYSLGLGIPFLLASLAFNLFLSTFEKVRRYMKVIIFVSGFFLIGIGILMLTGTFRELDGVSYFNDSKGTNVGAVLKSLESFSSPIILIAGGRDKAGDFSLMRQLVGDRVKALVLIGEASEKIGKALGDLTETIQAKDLKEAVAVSRKLSAEGDVVLLSPACASFDMFRDFEARGRQFKKIIMEMQ